MLALFPLETFGFVSTFAGAGCSRQLVGLFGGSVAALPPELTFLLGVILGSGEGDIRALRCWRERAFWKPGCLAGGAPPTTEAGNDYL